MMDFVLSYILFCHFGCSLLEAYYFLMREKKEMDPEERVGEEKLEGVEGAETIIRIHCMRKKVNENEKLTLYCTTPSRRT